MSVYNETGSGGVLLGGSADNSMVFNPPVSGLVLAGGEADATQTAYHYPNSSPTGVTIGGAADVRANYRLASQPRGGVVVGGRSLLRADYNYRPTGRSDNAPDFAGVTVGYESELSPSIVDHTFALDWDFEWQSDAYISLDYSFSWNTGRLNQYWYRIVGKSKDNGCPPVDTHDPCCQKFIMNIHARTLGELCEKLKKRRWKWPIESVQKFSIPAENAVVAAEEREGITHDCNDTTFVDICKNIACADFCVKIDVVEHLGCYATAQHVAVKQHTPHGGVVVGGIADVSYTVNVTTADFSYEAGDGVAADRAVVVGGTAGLKSTQWSYAGTGGVVVGGTAGLKSSHYDFVGGLWPSATGLFNPSAADEITEAGGDVAWLLPERALRADGLYAISDVSFLQQSTFLVVTGFDFEIPDDMEIVGIQATVKRHANSGVIKDTEVYLVVGDDIVSDNLAKTGVNWPVAVDATVTYGGLGNVWRDEDDPDYLGPWAVADVNDPTFGLAIRVQGGTNTAAVIASIDNIQLEVFYSVPTHQRIIVGGQAGVRTSAYHYAGSGGVVVAGTGLGGLKSAYRLKTTGRGALAPFFSGLLVGGQYAYHCHYAGSGGVVIDGQAGVKCTHWTYAASGGVVVGGESPVKSTNFHYAPTTGIEVGGEAGVRNAFVYHPLGGVAVGGSAFSGQKYHHRASGGVVIDGQADVRSSAFSWRASGGVTVGGAADYTYSDIGTLVIYGGLAVTASDVKVLFGLDIANIGTLPESPVTVLSRCNCTSLPLVMPFSHNMFRSNKLSQFFSRNGLTGPNITNLLYNRVNDSWQANQHFRGYSPNSTSKESWSIVYELACTSIVGGVDIGRNLWKMSVLIDFKDLVTLETLDTRVVVGFLPDKVCGPDEFFKVDISVDPFVGVAAIDPVSTVYQMVIFDNIGLFKNAFWMSNPEIVMSVSQGALSPNAPRYPLNIK